MKRYTNLWQDIISIENLREADNKARKGKLRSYGVRLHDKNREENILVLHEALKNKTFRTSPYQTFTIHEPKERLIYRLPYYPDRIVHHAVVRVLEPIWIKIFTYNTYSCIKGRGIDGCARQVEKIIKSYDGQPLYCLKMDVKKYYPSINHEVMKRIVRRKIKDKDVLWLIDEIIDSTDGLPIGNYLSQHLANLYLCYMMHWVNEQLPSIVADTLNLDEKPTIKATEYADDIVIFASNKEVLHASLTAIREYLSQELQLSIKDNYQVFPIAENRQDKHGRALDYVGYLFYRGQKLIRKSTKKNFCRATAKANKRKIGIKEYTRQLSPWLGWAKHSNSRHLLRRIIKKDHHAYVIRHLNTKKTN